MLEVRLATVEPEAIPDLVALLSRAYAQALLRLGRPAPSVPAPEEPERFLTIPDVAKRLGLSKGFVYELGRKGVLPLRRLGGSRGYRVAATDLAKWEASRENTVARHAVLPYTGPSSRRGHA